MVFPRLRLKDFFLSKVLWEHHSIQFFLHRFFFSVRVPGPRRYPHQNLLPQNQRAFYMIFFKQGNFCVSKLLWAYNGRFFFQSIFTKFNPALKEVVKIRGKLVGLSILFSSQWYQFIALWELVRMHCADFFILDLLKRYRRKTAENRVLL